MTAAVSASGWEYALLDHKVTFDYVERIFTVNDGVTELDIKTDIYSDFKEWFKLYDNSGKAPEALRTTGGDPTISGEFSGDIHFTQNNWRGAIDLRKVAVTGVLFSDDYATPWLNKDDLLPITPIRVASLVTQIQADISDLGIPTAPQIAAQVRAELSTELAEISATNTSTDYMQKIINNRKALVKDGSVWYLVVYDNDNVTEILRKVQQDSSGNNISDLTAGILAQELANSV